MKCASEKYRCELVKQVPSPIAKLSIFVFKRIEQRYFFLGFKLSDSTEAVATSDKIFRTKDPEKLNRSSGRDELSKVISLLAGGANI